MYDKCYVFLRRQNDYLRLYDNLSTHDRARALTFLRTSRTQRRHDHGEVAPPAEAVPPRQLPPPPPPARAPQMPKLARLATVRSCPALLSLRWASR